MTKAMKIQYFEMTNGTPINALNLKVNDTINVKPFQSAVVVIGFTKTSIKVKNVYSGQTFTIPNETKVIKTNTLYHGIHF